MADLEGTAMRFVRRIATVAILLAVSSAPLAGAKTSKPRLDGLAYLGGNTNSGGCSTLSVPAVIHGVDTSSAACAPVGPVSSNMRASIGATASPASPTA